MTSLLCKLFRFLLGTFEQVVNVVASAIKTVGNAAVDVLSDIWDNTIGSGGAGGIITLGLIGVGLYLLLTGLSDDEEESKGIADNGIASAPPDVAWET